MLGREGDGVHWVGLGSPPRFYQRWVAALSGTGREGRLHDADKNVCSEVRDLIYDADWLTQTIRDTSEGEHIEFKEAKKQFADEQVRRYCVALANEGGGALILGVSNDRPRRIVGTHAYSGSDDINDLKRKLLQWNRHRVEVHEITTPDGRVLVFEVPSRPLGNPLEVNGAYLMRSGESLVGMTADRLRTILAESDPDFMRLPAAGGLSADEVVSLLDTQALFDLLGVPYPSSREAVLDRLRSESLVEQGSHGAWSITNLGALAVAKNLSAISPQLGRKSPRVVVYDGTSKVTTRFEQMFDKGFAVAFPQLVDLVHAAAPRNRLVEDAIRSEVQMFPMQALRELIANALIHQDMAAGGARVMIELFDDRVEISNPGAPPIEVERFIDEYKSRNETFADLMRRFGICEEKGSGIDKVVDAVEVFQLPAPRFVADDVRTTAILYAHKDFREMDRDDRIRACYQHCCLQWVTNRRMTNESLRGRFGLTANQSPTASNIIAATREAGLIDIEDTGSNSTRYSRYRPFWA